MTTKELDHWADLVNLPFDGCYPMRKATERSFVDPKQYPHNVVYCVSL